MQTSKLVDVVHCPVCGNEAGADIPVLGGYRVYARLWRAAFIGRLSHAQRGVLMLPRRLRL
jgi:hypothetical protein